MKVLVLMALLVPCARAQVVAWRGSDSTLSDEAGIGATIYFPNDTSTAGGGFEDGSFRFGAATTFDWKGNEITAGDRTQSFNTSIGAGTYLASRGLTVIRKRDKWRAAFFMGGTGNSYSSPFFQAT